MGLLSLVRGLKAQLLDPLLPEKEATPAKKYMQELPACVCDQISKLDPSMAGKLAV